MPWVAVRDEWFSHLWLSASWRHRTNCANSSAMGLDVSFSRGLGSLRSSNLRNIVLRLRRWLWRHHRSHSRLLHDTKYFNFAMSRKTVAPLYVAPST